VHYLDETHILLFLIQFSVLLLLTRAGGELFRRWKQPALTVELLVGVALGPTLLGRFLPGVHAALFPADQVQQNMLETVAWIGVLFLLMDTGLEIDFSVAWRQRGAALVIALSDVIIPMVVAFVPCVLLPDRFLAVPDQRVTFALFMAVVMTISAMPVAARVLHDLNLLKTDLGFLTMSALAVNDIVGWVLFTIILGVFTQSALSVGPVLVVLAATVGFAVLALSLGRPVATWALARLRGLGVAEPATSFTFACLLGLLFGAVTQKIGIHALFGFFIAGVVMGEAKNLSEESRRIISQMVHALFVPLFFANIGLKIDFMASFDVLVVVVVTLVGIAGRYVGALFGVMLAKVPRRNHPLIAIAHTPGGMMEIVVALVAFESGMITAEIFVAIVFSAVFSSVVLGPWMRLAMARREAVSVSGFLPEGAVVTDLAAAERPAAIRALAATLTQGANTALAERVAQAALARELEFGTAVGSGVAIPHARLPGLAGPLLAYGRAVPGIEWDAADGEAVRHVFLLATPAGAEDTHAQILSQIARIMQVPGNRARLESAPDAAGLHRVLQQFFEAARGSAGRKAARRPEAQAGR